MRSVRLLVILAACSILPSARADDRAIRETLGDGLVDLISGAESMTLYRILSERSGEGECIDDYPIVRKRALAKEAMATIQGRLLAPATWGDGMAMCFEPHHALVIEKGGKSWTFVICFLCNYLTISPGEGTLCFGEEAPLLEAALEKALGFDALTPDLVREILPHFRGDEAYFPWLERLDAGAASALIEYDAGLSMGVTDLDPEAAAVLARYPHVLSLTRLERLGRDAAAHLARYRGEDLRIDGVPADAAAVVELARATRISEREDLDEALPAALEKAPPQWVRDLQDRIRTRKVRVEGTLDQPEIADFLSVVGDVDILPGSADDATEYEIPEDFGERTVEDVLRWMIDPTVFDDLAGGTSISGSGGEWKYSMGVIVVGSASDWPFDPAPPAGIAGLDAPMAAVSFDGGPEASLSKVLEVLARETGVAIRIDESVDPSMPVTLTLRHPLDAWRVLSILAEIRGCEYRVEDGGLVLTSR